MMNKSLRTRFILTFFVTMVIAGTLTAIASIFVIGNGIGSIVHHEQQELAEWMIASGDEYTEIEQLELASAGWYSVVRLEPDAPKVLKHIERLDAGEIVFDQVLSVMVYDTLFKLNDNYYCISIFPNSALILAVILAMSISIAGIITAGTLIASFTGKQFLKPIREIGKATRLIAQGDFSVRVSKPRNRELMELVSNFNSMTASLGKIESLQSDFINNVSHEFKTPLATISGFVTLLASDSLTPEERREYADIVADETRRLTKLSSNVLSLSKLEVSGVTGEVSTFSLDEQLRRTVLSLEPRWQEKQLELDISLEPVDVTGPRELYRQVFINLLDNAVKFSSEGGTLTLSLRKDGERAVVTVEDTGCGISPDDLPRIFDKFWQADPARRSDGNGLGLALTKRILEVSGGTIEVESTLGEGTVFTVRVPIGKSEK